MVMGCGAEECEVESESHVKMQRYLVEKRRVL